MKSNMEIEEIMGIILHQHSLDFTAPSLEALPGITGDVTRELITESSRFHRWEMKGKAAMKASALTAGQ